MPHWLKLKVGVMSVVSSEGDNFLGGKDLDIVVVDKFLLPLIKESYDIDNLDESEFKNLKRRLKRTADTTKNRFRQRGKCRIFVDLGDYGDDASGEEIEIDKNFNREDIHGPMTDIFMKAIGHAKTLLEVNNITSNDLTAFVLVGGPTQIPLFRELIEKEITKPDTSSEPYDSDC